MMAAAADVIDSVPIVTTIGLNPPQRDEPVGQTHEHTNQQSGDQTDPDRLMVVQQDAADAAGKRGDAGNGQVQNATDDADRDARGEDRGERRGVGDEDRVLDLREVRRGPHGEHEDQQEPQNEDPTVTDKDQPADAGRVPLGSRGRRRFGGPV